jgi:uncharacterized protein (DUF488 family)
MAIRRGEPTIIKITTIGVYGFNEESFFDALQEAGVHLFCDVRWRRGVRGSDNAFANHKRLEARLNNLGIEYLHRRDLAPTPELREKQFHADKAAKVAKRERLTLSPDFVNAYCEEVLPDFDPRAFLEELPEGTSVVSLFCVEREPAACHRSLIADLLNEVEGVTVEHIIPGS